MYDTDLNDEEWAIIAPFFEKGDPRGAPEKYFRREVVNAILYVVKTGCGWRYLPHEYPKWKTVYRHFQIWNERGVWEEALDHLNEQARLQMGKKSNSKLRYRRRTKLQDPVRVTICWD